MMRLLVVTKTTNFELHGERVRSSVAKGKLRKQHIERLQASHLEHFETLDLVKSLLNKFKVDYEILQRAVDWPEDHHYDAVLTVGGDGTLLAASHQLRHGGLLMGIKSSDASVGYLCACDRNNLESYIVALVQGALSVIEVKRLKASVHDLKTGKNTETVPVLNDFLFANEHPASTTRYKISLGAKRETQKSSGVWIAAPSGSTAAISSAGGERVPQDSEIFQYRVRELFVPKGEFYQLLGGRIDVDRDKFEIENRCSDAILALDGQHGQVSLGFGDTVHFMRAPSLRLAVSKTPR